jgi:hypothetical protein
VTGAQAGVDGDAHAQTSHSMGTFISMS